MVNVLMTETVIPIHRHNDTSETVVICRGAVREGFYNDCGEKIAEFVLEAGGECPAVQVRNPDRKHPMKCIRYDNRFS